MKKFDIYWYSFKYEDDLRIVKTRPVLVLDEDIIIPVAKITSTLDIRTKSDYTIVNWKESGLTKPSVIRFDKKELVIKSALSEKDYIGHLSEEDIQNITKLHLVEMMLFENDTDYDYGPADSLPEMTPYMLRQDGALLKCGDIHPYIKMSTKTSYETNLHTLDIHPEFLDWFYENTLDLVTKDLIDKFRKEPTPELMDVLNDLTNEDFCRVRTSNYKVKSGGKNGQIYFRISSTNFDWFNLIWGVVAKFVHDIDNVTVMKDSQTFGGKEFDYYYDHVPVDEFLTLKGNPEIK